MLKLTVEEEPKSLWYQALQILKIVIDNAMAFFIIMYGLTKLYFWLREKGYIKE